MAIVAAFSALIVGSNFALASLVDVKLLDSVVFLTAFVFGFKTGAAVAVVSETAWSFVSPWGMAGVMTPFLVGGELLFAVAGWGAARLWGRVIPLGSPYPIFIGATMAVCAFVWDLETNAATALVAYWPRLTAQNLLLTEAYGTPFFITHFASDLLLGAIFVPLAASLILRNARGVT